MKPYWLAVLAYVVCTFLIAAPWHLVLFKPVYDELAIFTRKEPLIPLGLLSMLIQGLVLSSLYPLVAQGRHSAKTGAMFGLLMGVLLASSAVFAEAGKQNVTSLSTWLLLESGYYLFQFAVVGAIMGLVYSTVPSRGER
ncbi:MAG: DUF1761 domain-containing protein [Nitrospirae bacterium]|nr:DUF1761 domain-containing protein [Nitrospirota bacterium]